MRISVVALDNRCQLFWLLSRHRVDMSGTVPAGRLAELEDLYCRHAGDLLKLAVLMTGSQQAGEEVLHDAYLNFYNSKGSQNGKEKAYLRRTVINLSRSYHRHLSVVARTVEPMPTDAAGTDASALRLIVNARVVDAVSELPRRQRECVILHYYEQLSDGEISEALGITPGSVKTHLHRARERLRTDLGEFA